MEMNMLTKIASIALGAVVIALPLPILAAPDSAQQAIIQKAQQAKKALAAAQAASGAQRPAADIQSLIKERPKARDLAVRGMPQGSPGMEAPHGERYDVVLIATDGSTRAYRSYAAT
jgi:hypothetical protein